MDILVTSGIEFLPYLAFLGVGLIVAEFLLPTKGILGVIGAALFVFGTITLTTHPDPHIRISILTCIILNVIVLGTSLLLAYFTYRGYTAQDGNNFDLVNRVGQVVEWNSDHQRIEIDGVFWSAITRDNRVLEAGQDVKVIAQRNLTLTVTPVTETTGDFS